MGKEGRWGSSPQTLAKEPSALWTLIRGGLLQGCKARLAEGEPGLRGSRRGVFDPFRWARRDAEHAGFYLSVTAAAVTPSPLGKEAWLVELGRDSPTVAPLRVKVTLSVMVERGGVLLRRPTEVTQAPSAMGRVWRQAACLCRVWALPTRVRGR